MSKLLQDFYPDLGWLFHRRPREERQLWIDLAAATQENETRKEELRAMAQMTARTMYDEALEQAAHHILLMQGRKRFGEPSPEMELAMRKIEDLERLDRMSLRLLDVTTWRELLETQ